MDFLGAVNRILVNAYILKGDDEPITSFADNQHVGTLRVARQAVETELNSLLSFFSLDYERSQMIGSITTVVGQRTYALPANFVQFWGDHPYLTLTTDNAQRLYEFKGGENRLRQLHHDYKTNQGKENWWYWAQDTTKKIGLFQIPNAIRTYEFDYEKDATVSNSTDPLPFQTEAESQAFADRVTALCLYGRKGPKPG